MRNSGQMVICDEISDFSEYFVSLGDGFDDVSDASLKPSGAAAREPRDPNSDRNFARNKREAKEQKNFVLRMLKKNAQRMKMRAEASRIKQQLMDDPDSGNW